MAGTAVIVEVLGGPSVVGRGVRTLDQLEQRLRAGLPFQALEAVRGALGISRDTLARTLRLPTRTLARRRRERLLQPDESDRLYRMARVYAHAREVFDDTEKASSWMTRGSRALGGRAPVELLDTDIGVQRVDHLLGRIEHGLVS